jgi:cytochrome c-type biogenesis protein
VTAGFVVVFGLFGLALMPVAGWLLPRMPWVTVLLGLALVLLGALLVAGRSLPVPGRGVKAPRLTGAATSMVLFGMAYAIASLGCAIGPFLALVVSSLRAGSILAGVALFVAYATGMGLVVGVTAVAVALLRRSVVTRLRRVSSWAPRVGGAVLVAAGAYVGYYGWYELRLVDDPGLSGRDPVVNLASEIQRFVSTLIGRMGAIPVTVALIVLTPAALLPVLRRRTSVGS